MNYTKKSLVTFLSISMISLIAMPAVMAQEVVANSEPETSTTTPMKDRMENLKEQVEERTDARCELLTSRIELNITRYESNKARHVDRYQKIKEKVSQFLAKAEGLGYDVTVLKADLQKLDTMTQEFATLYQAFITELKDTKNYACGESEGKFKEELSQARTKLMEVREKSFDIRSFINSTIKPDLQALRDQKKQ